MVWQASVRLVMGDHKQPQQGYPSEMVAAKVTSQVCGQSQPEAALLVTVTVMESASALMKSASALMTQCSD